MRVPELQQDPRNAHSQEGVGKEGPKATEGVKEAKSFEHYWLIPSERKDDRSCKLIRFMVSLSLPKSLGAELGDRGRMGT